MKQLKTTTIAAIILLLLPTATFAQSKMQMSAGEQINKAYISGITAGNLDALMKLYTKDASIRNSDQSVVSGIDNIKAQYKATLESGKYSITLDTIVDETPLGNEYVFESGNYVFTQLDGDKMVVKGQFVNVLKKEKDGWKIYRSYRYDVGEK